jgi:hypothetical protein
MHTLIRQLALAVFRLLGFTLTLTSLFAESKLIQDSGLTGGIVVALDFENGKAVADLTTDRHFLVHGLMSSEAALDQVRSLKRPDMAGCHAMATTDATCLMWTAW